MLKAVIQITYVLYCSYLLLLARSALVLPPKLHDLLFRSIQVCRTSFRADLDVFNDKPMRLVFVIIPTRVPHKNFPIEPSWICARTGSPRGRIISSSSHCFEESKKQKVSFTLSLSFCHFLFSQAKEVQRIVAVKQQALTKQHKTNSMKLFFATHFIALTAITAQSINESNSVSDPLEIDLVDIKVRPLLLMTIV